MTGDETGWLRSIEIPMGRWQGFDSVSGRDTGYERRMRAMCFEKATPPGPVYWVATSLLGLLAVACLVVGCKGRPKPVGGGAEEFQLVTVDGRALPCVVGSERGRPEVRSGRFTVRPDGTCESDITFVVGGRGEVQRSVRADYVRNGDHLTMRWRGAGTTLGEIAGDNFSMTNEGVVFVYRRQVGSGTQP